MLQAGPQTYHSLKPFHALFAAGLPILTWHKLGPRPPGARLKGLYMSARLFTRQMAELSQAGFNSISLDELGKACGLGDKKNTIPNPTSNPAIVLTFDDGYENVLSHALKPLAQARFEAIQFLVADRLGQTNDWDLASGEIQERLMDRMQLQEWLQAGHKIGAHTLTHPFLTRIKPARAREEIFASKKKLEDLFALPIDHFCYPYGDWNPTIRDMVAEAGYQTACTTDFGVNNGAAPFTLKRITARYRSRNLTTLVAWLTSLLGSSASERSALRK